jgi:hypothetical protein
MLGEPRSMKLQLVVLLKKQIIGAVLISQKVKKGMHA